jgi:hypothetical protein
MFDSSYSLSFISVCLFILTNENNHFLTNKILQQPCIFQQGWTIVNTMQLKTNSLLHIPIKQSIEIKKRKHSVLTLKNLKLKIENL